MDQAYRDRLERLIIPCVFTLAPMHIVMGFVILSDVLFPLVMLLSGFTLGLMTAQLMAHRPAMPQRDAP